MKKKIIATALSAAIIIGAITSNVLAQEQLITSSPTTITGIEFQEVYIHPHIPRLDTHGLPDTILTMEGLDFHRHYIYPRFEIFESWTDVEGQQSAIGLPVYSSVRFQVSVALSDFRIEGQQRITNAGSRLELFPGGKPIENGSYIWQSWNNETNPTRVNLFPRGGRNMITAGSFVPLIVAESSFASTGIPLQWAANLAARLHVDSGTSRPGDAQAEMTWSIVALENFDLNG